MREDATMDNGGWRRGERAGVVLFSAALLGAVLAPLRQYRRPLRERVDGFPLSWYPMFSARRRRCATLGYAVGVRADGSRRYLPSSALGPGGVNQVRRQLNKAVREGRAQPYAEAVAQRVCRLPRCADVTRVEVVRGHFDLDRCLVERPPRAAETVVAAAEVPTC
ncbi:MAG: hypothetical protein ACR2GH_12365 [Pseudonocardia sp.]